MSRTIHCAKLGTDAEGLDFAPWPGPLGQRIYAEISKLAWQQWLAHQTMLINEYRLNPLEPKARQFLAVEMENFLFATGEVQQPAGYVAPEPEPDSGTDPDRQP
jgi:Fe-S cluster biosynthesis and repair protein YggX